MLNFLKKVLIKALLYMAFIFFTLIIKLYKIIYTFCVKHKSKFKKFLNYTYRSAMCIEGLYSQINLKKEFQRCLINSK